MNCKVFRLIPLLIFVISCSSTLQPNSPDQKKHERKNILSLQNSYKELAVGMKREEIESILGTPDYSPMKGKYYYASSQKLQSESQENEITIGIIVDYRSLSGDETDSLKNFWIGQLKDYKTMLSGH